MARLLRIENCGECPFVKEWEKGIMQYFGCSKKIGGWFEPKRVNPDSIPDWCPLPEASGWIPVGERVPAEGIDVLVLRKLRRPTARGKRHVILSALYYDGDWGAADGESWIGATSVTHWMPLPSLPEESTDEG